MIRPLAPERALPRPCRSIASAYERWPELRVLDARDEVSFAHGHPEGAGRLTIEEFSTRRMELPARETALLVVHDAPAHALAAAEELVARGYEHASWLEAPLAEDGMGRVSDAPAARLWSPSPFVERAVERLPRGRALDLACGSGRAAVFLALAGWQVEGWDVDPSALERARDFAARQHVPVLTREIDLEAAPPAEPTVPFDLIVVVRYLHRPLFPWLERALGPGGRLVYETFRDGQQHFGPPRRAQHLLRPGELRVAFPSLVVERHEETPGDAPPLLARLVARKPR